MSKTYSYESGYSRSTIEKVSGKNVMYPAMMEYGDGLYALLSEAELYIKDNAFYGSCLHANGGAGAGAGTRAHGGVLPSP